MNLQPRSMTVRSYCIFGYPIIIGNGRLSTTRKSMLCCNPSNESEQYSTIRYTDADDPLTTKILFGDAFGDSWSSCTRLRDIKLGMDPVSKRNKAFLIQLLLVPSSTCDFWYQDILDLIPF